MNDPTHRSSRELRYRNIAIACLALLCVALMIYILFHTDFMQYQLETFGLSDKYHTSNRTTISSWNSCLNKLNIDADIVFFGDSITARYDFQSAFPDKMIVNLGLNGDSILDMMNRVYMIGTVKPEKIFLMAGVNSLKNQKMIEKYYYQYISLVNDIREAVPSARLFVISVLPVSASHDNALFCNIRGLNNSFIVSFNEMIRQYADENNLTYINLYPYYELKGALDPEYSVDGVHITNESYRFWIDAIKEYIYE